MSAWIFSRMKFDALEDVLTRRGLPRLSCVGHARIARAPIRPATATARLPPRAEARRDRPDRRACDRASKALLVAGTRGAARARGARARCPRLAGQAATAPPALPRAARWWRWVAATRPPGPGERATQRGAAQRRDRSRAA